MKKVFLSVVIPCYNEEANIRAGALDEVAQYLRKQKYTWEVIISDDGSTDGSKRLVKNFVKKKPGFILLENKHGGKAYALHCAIEKAKGELILTTDLDQSTPVSEVEKLLPWFDRDYEVVIGSRGLVRKNAPWYRRLMALGFRVVRGFFVLWEIDDTQCGFKAYKAAMVKKIFPKLEAVLQAERAKGWRVSAFDVEALFMAKKQGFKIKEVVVDWQDRDISETKKHNFIKESKNMASEVWRVRVNDWRGKYGENAKIKNQN